MKASVYGSTRPASGSGKAARTSSSGSIVRPARPKFTGRTCWLPWGDGPVPTISASIGPALFRTSTDQLRTNVPGVWALGDCNGRGAFTHTAYNDFEIVAANLLDSDPRRLSDRITAYALYIDPPLGRAGLTEDQVRRIGKRALIGERPMTSGGRAVEKGETQGFMKVLVDADNKEILGAAILGTGGDEVVHGILDVMYAKAPYTVLQRSMPLHPTVSELLPTLLGDLQPL